MELQNKETIENYSLEGVDLKGEVQVKNGKITKCIVSYGKNITCADDSVLLRGNIELTEQDVRDMHKEFGALLSMIDKQKGVGNV